MSGIMMLLLAGAAKRYTEIKTFTATGSWTAPTGVTEVEYLIVAGGGGGGRAFGGGGGATRLVRLCYGARCAILSFVDADTEGRCIYPFTR